MSQLARKRKAKSMPATGAAKLPSSLCHLFWEHDFKALTWGGDRDLIISKVLESGTWDDICWLRRALTKEELRAWLLARKGRGLDERRLSYWGLMLSIPDRTVSAWTRKLMRDPWHGRANQ
jgi:hypothetical protein